jgi:hypothetical protein
MTKNRFALIALSVILLTALVGCGSIAPQATATPVPTSTTVPTNTPIPIPPKLGHYVGTNPDVSFDITASGVENFTITIPFGGDVQCKLGPFDPTSIKPDSTFTISLTVSQDSTAPDTLINGTIGENEITGKYSDDFCSNGGYSEQITPGFSGTWSASLK